MNLTINNTNFNGKQEVIYGLTRASYKAKQIEMFKNLAKGPRPINTSEDINRTRAAMEAYLDMTINDDSFNRTVVDIAAKREDVSSIRENLVEQNLPNGIIKPFETFTNALRNVISENKKYLNNDLLYNFFANLK